MGDTGFMDTKKLIAERSAALNYLAEMDATKWGEAERVVSKELHAHDSHRRLLETIATRLDDKKAATALRRAAKALKLTVQERLMNDLARGSR